MPLGSALTSLIDIDFTRAQGENSTGRITFKPTRMRVGTTMVSSFPVVVPIVNGVAQVTLVRLALGTYSVLEEIDGRPPFRFKMMLPNTSAEVIQYETIAHVGTAPAYFTFVKTINNVAPDPVTGNITVATGGTPADATSSTKGVLQLAGDLAGTAASPTLSTARAAEISGKYVKPGGGIPESDLAAAVQSLLSDAASAAQPADLDAVIALIPTTKAGVGLGNVDNTSDLNKPVSTATEAAIGARALPDRIIRIADRSKEPGDVRTYNMANTSNSWALFVDGPAEYTIAAAVNDYIEAAYNCLIAAADTSFVDLVVVTGGTPAPQRYLSSNASTPSFQGNTSNYPTGGQFEGRSGTLGFFAQAGDIDSGFVRLRWAIKTNSDLGKMYANNNYPLLIRIRNTRLSGV